MRNFSIQPTFFYYCVFVFRFGPKFFGFLNTTSDYGNSQPSKYCDRIPIHFSSGTHTAYVMNSELRSTNTLSSLIRHARSDTGSFSLHQPLIGTQQGVREG